jgi:hypothetical protein
VIEQPRLGLQLGVSALYEPGQQPLDLGGPDEAEASNAEKEDVFQGACRQKVDVDEAESCHPSRSHKQPTSRGCRVEGTRRGSHATHFLRSRCVRRKKSRKLLFCAKKTPPKRRPLLLAAAVAPAAAVARATATGVVRAPSQPAPEPLPAPQRLLSALLLRHSLSISGARFAKPIFCGRSSTARRFGTKKKTPPKRGLRQPALDQWRAARVYFQPFSLRRRLRDVAAPGPPLTGWSASDESTTQAVFAPNPPRTCRG